MAVSQTIQDYAAEIYRQQQEIQPVPLSSLAAALNHSAQAIANTVQRMQKEGFLIYEPYRGVCLTAQGERIAMPALRRHRLVEVFLVQVMQYDWAAAHALADHFSLGVNEEIEERLDLLTGHPKRCPHGEPIPDRQGKLPRVEDRPMIEVPSGSDCTISRVRTHDPEVLRYLAELGLQPGVPFHLYSCAPFKGPLRLQTEQQDYVIGFELAEKIRVAVHKMGQGNSPVQAGASLGQRRRTSLRRSR